MFPVVEQQREIDSLALQAENYGQTMVEIKGRQDEQETRIQSLGETVDQQQTEIQNQNIRLKGQERQSGALKRQMHSFNLREKRQKTSIGDLCKAQEQQQTQIGNLSAMQNQQETQIQNQGTQISQLQRRHNTTAASVNMGNVFHVIKISSGRLRCPIVITLYVSVSKNIKYKHRML